jgi:hypothetical protein
LECSAHQLFETMSDREYHEARLAGTGGPGAALLNLDVDGPPEERVEFTVRMGVDRAYLPLVVRKVLPGNLVIERTETWAPAGQSDYAGTIAATVVGAPGRVSGTVRLANLPAGRRPASELRMDASAQVPLPLVGGRLEAAIAEQVEELIDREARFTIQWLASR